MKCFLARSLWPKFQDEKSELNRGWHHSVGAYASAYDSHTCTKWVQVQVPTALLQMQLLGNVPTKAMEDGTSAWACDTQAGDVDGVPVSWLQPGLASAVVSIWGEHYQIKIHLSLSSVIQLNKKV